MNRGSRPSLRPLITRSARPRDPRDSILGKTSVPGLTWTTCYSSYNRLFSTPGPQRPLSLDWEYATELKGDRDTAQLDARRTDTFAYVLGHLRVVQLLNDVFHVQLT